MREKHLSDFNSISLDELKILRDFLEPLKNASDELEATKYPTLHLVHPWYYTILSHFQPNSLDPAMIGQMKSIGLAYWTTNVHTFITRFHDVAVCLHPEMKELRLYTEQERHAAWKKVEELMENISPRNVSRTESRDETNRKTAKPKKRIISKAMQCLISDRNNDDTLQLNELDEYRCMIIRHDIDSLLDWWEDRKTRFPRLYAVARFIHSIPASSASAERLFSKAGRIVTFRPNMRSSLVDELLFLKSNIDLFNQMESKSNDEESNLIENDIEGDSENESQPRENCEDEYLISEVLSDTDVET